MQLSVADVARLLCVAEETVARWIDGEGLPAQRFGDQLRMNRAEVLEWALARGIPLSTEVPGRPGSEDRLPSLVGALLVGGVHHRVVGHHKREVLRSAVATLRLPDESDRDTLLAVLLARESLGSTGIGQGIAIPHVRNPIVIHLSPPALTLCFLETPVEFDAIDGKPVHTLFLITSPSARSHLHLLSRLTVALRDTGVRATLASRESPERILEAFGRIEKSIPEPWVRATE